MSPVPKSFLLASRPWEEEISPEEFVRIREHPEKRVEFLRKQLRLVHWVTKKFTHVWTLPRPLSAKCRRSEDYESVVSYLDCFQEGYIGLEKALDKFDPFRGFKFSTYAVWWISSGIRNLHRQCPGMSVRIVANILEEFYKLKDLIHSGKASWTQKERHRSLAALIQTSKHPLRWYQKGQGSRNDLELTLLEITPQTTEPKPERPVIRKEDVQELRQWISEVLTEKEATIVRMRYPQDGDIRPLREIGGVLGLTRERVRQIETHAILKLRMRWKVGEGTSEVLEKSDPQLRRERVEESNSKEDVSDETTPKTFKEKAHKELQRLLKETSQLRRQLDHNQTRIRGLEAYLNSGKTRPSSAIPKTLKRVSKSRPSSIGPTPRGMAWPIAQEVLMENQNKPMRYEAIYEGMIRKGFVTRATDPSKAVYAILSHNSQIFERTRRGVFKLANYNPPEGTSDASPEIPSQEDTE